MGSLQETWLSVDGFEYCYAVSNTGKIKRVKGGRGSVAGRILKPGKDRDGYLYVTLSEYGIRKRMTVHQIVCRAFKGAPPSLKHEPNHVHGDPANNNDWNLEWVTRKQNNLHKCRVLKKVVGASHPNYGKKGHLSKFSKEYVLISPSGALLKVKGLKKFCADNDLSDGNMFKVMNGTIKHHKGWKCKRA